MAGFDPDVFGGTTAPAGFDPDVFAGKATPPLVVAMPKAAPAAIEAGTAINSIPRQLGLTARYGIEGLANAAQIVTEPIRYVTDRLTQQTGKTLPLGELTSRGLDALGLPKPQGANERVIGDATRLVAGAGGMGALAGAPVQIGRFGGSLFSQAPSAMASRTATATGYLPRDLLTAAQSAPVSSTLSANMGAQISSAAGAGLAGGASREGGGSSLMQGAAALGGGVLAGLAPGAAGSVVNAGKSLVKRVTETPQQLDQQISVLLQRADVDYSQLPAGVRNSLRSDLASALRAGDELDPAAVRRLADFKLTNTTPTRGMVSQNPVQITREMNLAKIGANSSDEALQGLPLIQNRNNSQLIRNLNDAGANQGDPFRAGETAIGAIRGQDEALNRGVSALYGQARDTAGRSATLDGAAFTAGANRALDDGLLGGALPESVATHMNRIARGEVPFTVDYAEQLKTAIGNLQRATTDGQARMALGVVRRALDDTPLMQAPKVNPGNLPAVPGTVPPSPSVLGRESLDAFNQARQAARQRFAWQESGRPIEAALNGAQPDRFVQQFVIGGTLDDARAVAQNAPVSEVKNAILAHLKDKSLNGAADEVGKFSQSAFNRALNQIGERKLALFFSPEEITALRANGRVASYMQVQPVGSAVNNSNTGALMLGKGYDALMGLTNKVPVLGPMLVPPIKNIEIAMRNRQAQNVLPGLLAAQPRQPMTRNLLLPSAAVGGTAAGLLSAQ
jgi:hypothetical protein